MPIGRGREDTSRGVKKALYDISVVQVDCTTNQFALHALRHL